MRIKELRNELNLSQQELAKAIHTSQRNISRWENGENEPTSSFLIVLANFFQCSIDYLVERSDDFGNVSIPSGAGERLTQEEKAMLSNYRKLNKTNRMHADAYILVRLENQQEGTPHRA